jgi:hypothetical protein
MACSTASIAWRRASRSVWRYRSVVRRLFSPRSFDTCTSGRAALTSVEPNQCRQEWKVNARGRPARRLAALKAALIVVIGRPASSGLGNTYGEVPLAARSASSVCRTRGVMGSTWYTFVFCEGRAITPAALSTVLQRRLRMSDSRRPVPKASSRIGFRCSAAAAISRSISGHVGIHFSFTGSSSRFCASSSYGFRSM